MNLVIKSTPPTQTYSLDLPNGIMFSDEGLDLPLHIRGAQFQRRVWEALSTVRIGAVITYAALSRRIGQPDAISAVANACANSPFAIAISCQRVVRTNRRLGYEAQTHLTQMGLARECSPRWVPSLRF